VTGSGKTDVALTAIDDAVTRGLFALVIVPSRVLMEQPRSSKTCGTRKSKNQKLSAEKLIY